MTLCPWARHVTLLASGECPCTYFKSLWIRVSAKWVNVNVFKKMLSRRPVFEYDHPSEVSHPFGRKCLFLSFQLYCTLSSTIHSKPITMVQTVKPLFVLCEHTQRSQVAELLGYRAGNQKVAGSLSQPCLMVLCPWARHFTLLASGECPCTYCKSLWIKASAKWLNVNV